MPAATGVYVTGLRELSSAFNKLGGEVRKEYRTSERQIAEPIRRDAESLAMSEVRNMPASPKWSKMRIGVTRDLIYVVPRQRGVKGRGQDPRRRGPQFTRLMMDRAMRPALARNEADVTRGIEQLLDRVTQQFNRR
jgi:hypothetical protein